MAEQHRVVILGGGFGGLYAAKALRHAHVSVTLIDKRNYHLFQPLLYQVATGSLSPGEIAAPLRAILRGQANTRVLLGDAISLDATNRRVILQDGEVPYDSLIVACGARNFYYGHNEWEAAAPGLKSIDDATRMRAKVLYAFEEAEKETDPEARKAWLTFAIVGAGPTGVELAGALSEISRDTLKNDFRSIKPEEAQILLLEGGDRLLATFPPSLSAAAEKELVGLGVRPRTGVKVTDMDDQGVTLSTQSGEEHLATRTVLWAAGVRAAGFGEVLAQCAGAHLDREGRVMVSPDLSIPGRPEIRVIGDLAHCVDPRTNKPLPGVAPVAMQQGEWAAHSIVERLKGGQPTTFHYWNKGNLAVIGRGKGVADFGFLKLSGLLAWLLWLVVHLMYLVGFQNRILVFLRWGFQYLTFSRGARLITDEDQPQKASFPPERPWDSQIPSDSHPDPVRK